MVSPDCVHYCGWVQVPLSCVGNEPGSMDAETGGLAMGNTTEYAQRGRRRPMTALATVIFGMMLLVSGCGRSLDGTYVHSTETTLGTVEETLEFRNDGTFIAEPDGLLGTYEIDGDAIVLYREILGSTVVSKGTIDGDTITVDGLLGGEAAFTKRQTNSAPASPPPDERFAALFVREAEISLSDIIMHYTLEFRQDGKVIFSGGSNPQAQGTYTVDDYAVTFGFEPNRYINAPETGTFSGDTLVTNGATLPATYTRSPAPPPADRFDAMYASSFYEPSSLSTITETLEFRSDGTVIDG